MFQNKILDTIYNNQVAKRKSFAILLDPDKLDEESLSNRIDSINKNKVDFVFVGGSLISSDNLNYVLTQLKKHTNVPKIIFPGNGLHIDSAADGILLLSLISGRNPEYLIGQHVISAPLIKRSKLEILSTGYILVDGGTQTTVSYISNTTPIPNNKPDIAVCTALAGEMLGFKLLYLDAGSGSLNPVNPKLINSVKSETTIPLIVGGGLNTYEKAKNALDAGADIVVIGNAIETNPSFIEEIAKLVQSYNFSFAL